MKKAKLDPEIFAGLEAFAKRRGKSKIPGRGGRDVP
jgi:hypothetical protein